MPKIIVQANQPDGAAGCMTLSERVLANHLQDGHYAAQLIERLTWAAIDAERLESPTDDDADEHRALRLTRPPDGPASSGPPTDLDAVPRRAQT